MREHTSAPQATASLKFLRQLETDFDMDDVKILGRRLMGSDKIDETMRKK